VFIFYKSYFEGEEMAPDFPLRGKEDGENERAMSSSGGGSMVMVVAVIEKVMLKA
jgi:hypothetical protein